MVRPYSLHPRLTILRDPQSPADDAATLALGALGWVLADSRRAERLLGMTGLTPEVLRTGLGDPAVLAAVLEFLAGHEPDLLAAAEYLGVGATALIAAKESLAG